jgi:hypothetical protein
MKLDHVAALIFNEFKLQFNNGALRGVNQSSLGARFFLRQHVRRQAGRDACAPRLRSIQVMH